MRLKRRFAQSQLYVRIERSRRVRGRKPRKTAWTRESGNKAQKIAQFPFHPPVHELHSIDE